LAVALPDPGIAAAAVSLVSLPVDEALGWALLVGLAVALVPAVFIGTLVLRLMSKPVKKVCKTLAHPVSEKDGRLERASVRLVIPVLLLGSAAGAVIVSLHATKSEIPSFAFGSHAVLAVQLSLLFFYAALLLGVPLVRALAGGELPIELSMRGARFAEKLGESNKETLDRLKELEKRTTDSDAQARASFKAMGESIENRASAIDQLFAKQDKINQALVVAIGKLEGELQEHVTKSESTDPGAV
jgi:uncharacterized membrane protein